MYSRISVFLALAATAAATNSTAEALSPPWGSPAVNYAVIVSVGAGLSTGIGGALVFFPALLKNVAQERVLGVSLALSAGVMLYVSFIDIFKKSLEKIEASPGATEGFALGLTTLCFFLGMAFCVALELLVKWLSSRDGGAGHNHICVANGGLPQLSHAHAHASADSMTTGGGDACCEEGGHGHEHDHTPNAGGSTSTTKAAASEVTIAIKGDAAGGVSAADAARVAGGGLADAAEAARLARMGAMTALAIGVHNFPEGLATFLATVEDTKVGLSLGVAIAIHNIPEGLCVAMPIYYATGNKWRAFGWSLLSGVTEPIGGLVGYAALRPVFTDLIYGVVFSMVGGMMVFIVIHELLPAAHRYLGREGAHVASAWLVFGMAIMAFSLIAFTF